MIYINTAHDIKFHTPIKDDGWVGHIACTEELRNACRHLVEKPEGKRLLQRPE
jgi:hypothetical protein